MSVCEGHVTAAAMFTGSLVPFPGHRVNQRGCVVIRMINEAGKKTKFYYSDFYLFFQTWSFLLSYEISATLTSLGLNQFYLK